MKKRAVTTIPKKMAKRKPRQYTDQERAEQASILEVTAQRL
jgi:hypothetical protein